MSHSLGNEKDSKRQRILRDAKAGELSSSASSPSGLTSSRAMSPPCLDKESNDSASFPAHLSHDPPESGPIFTDVQEIGLCSNIESALGVPTRILFRCVGGDQKISKSGASSNSDPFVENRKKQEKENRRRSRPLLSRQEAEQFLRLTLVAQEIDVLVDLSETILSRRHFARQFRRTVLMQHDPTFTRTDERPWRNPWLITLGPILDVLEQRQSHPSRLLHNSCASDEGDGERQMLIPQDNMVKHIHSELIRLYHELQACGIYELERSAEQNRSLVSSLTDILDYHCDDDVQHDRNIDSGARTFAVRDLAREKLSLSKLQDLIAKRVRSLLVVLCHSHEDVSAEMDDSFEDVARSGSDIDRNDYIEKGRKRILFDDDSPSTSVDTMTKDLGNDKKFPTRKPGSHEEVAEDEDETNGDNESSNLSLEQILVPLEVVCEKLFPRDDRSTLTESMTTTVQAEKSKSHRQSVINNSNVEGIPVVIEQTQNKKSQRQDQSANESSLSNAARTISNANPFIPTGAALGSKNSVRIITTEASQRTAGVADIMVGLAKTTEQNAFAQKKAPTMDYTVHDNVEQVTGDIASAFQRTFGAASTMMALATKAEDTFTTTTDKQPTTKFDNTDGNGENGDGDTPNRNGPFMKQHGDDDAHDDSSFVEDPPDDVEDVRGEIPQKDELAGSKDKVTKDNVGIFDVVDILTPQSQIMEQSQSSK